MLLINYLVCSILIFLFFLFSAKVLILMIDLKSISKSLSFSLTYISNNILFPVLFILFSICFYQIIKKRIKVIDTTSLRNKKKPNMLLFFILIVAIVLLQLILTNVFDVNPISEKNIPSEIIIIACVYGCIVAPIIEEYYFRYIFFKMYGKFNTFSIILNAIYFSIFHYKDILGFVLFFIIALFFLTIFYVIFNSLFLNIILHAINNSCFYFFGILLHNSNFPNMIFVFMLLLLIILLYYIYKMYRKFYETCIQ